MSANRAEVESVLRCEGIRKNPLFMPAIYEHKGFFIDETPSNISRDADLFTRAVLAEFEAIGNPRCPPQLRRIPLGGLHRVENLHHPLLQSPVV